jgi:predicted DNA-binding protein YlxM (UPF0122 family)
MSYDILPLILGDSVQVRLVEFFLVHQDNLYQLTQIAKMMDISHSRVHDLIGRLVKTRLVFETKHKRNRLFQLNKEHPIVKRLLDLYKITKAYKSAREL